MKRFVGQVAVITGGASGIGKACAMRFAEEGGNVAVMDISDENNEAVAEACRQLGVEALALHLNAADEENVDRAFKAVLDRWGRIDILVAAAGIHSSAPINELPLKQWQRAVDINLTGVFLSNRAVAETMMNQKSGSIINISSMAGKTSFPATSEYSATKSGVIGLTRSVALDLAPYGVTVNAVCPGNTLTEMVKSVAAVIGGRDGMTAEEWLAMRANDCPMKRIAEPWEIAGVVAFLSSQDSRYITGQAIEVDGGMVLA
jgi:NAD(P)-dependent dehydrogenase (short-subunit alcohol dehydrogenase family)